MFGLIKKLAWAMEVHTSNSYIRIIALIRVISRNRKNSRKCFFDYRHYYKSKCFSKIVVNITEIVRK